MYSSVTPALPLLLDLQGGSKHIGQEELINAE